MINEIQNGETGISVRGKLNQMRNALNVLDGHGHSVSEVSGFDSAVDARLFNLPNGAIIGGVAHFFQSSPPVTRRDGSPLQIGDRWINGGVSGFWNGTFWLSTEVTHLSSFSVATVSASTVMIAHWGNLTASLDGSRLIQTPFKFKPFGVPYRIFFDSIAWTGNIGANGIIDSSNYWDLDWRIVSRRNSPVEATVTSFKIPEKTYSAFNIFEAAKANILFTFSDANADSATGGGDFVNGLCRRTGNPPPLVNQSLRASFREVLA